MKQNRYDRLNAPMTGRETDLESLASELHLLESVQQRWKPFITEQARNESDRWVEIRSRAMMEKCKCVCIPSVLWREMIQ